jgi:hypothetical protein
MDPYALAEIASVELLQFKHAWPDSQPPNVGALPDKWNRIVDEGDAVAGASLLHWTAGLPAFPHYENAPGAELWVCARDKMLAIA